nr:hypothetical protein [Tanacetum cinerariifolium]
MLLPLGGCEMVLGIQWLATFGDMQCNFKKLIMKFNHKGRQLVLRGMNNTHVHRMQGNKEMLKQAELSSMALCVYPVQLCQMESVGSVSAEVEQFLTQFDEVFEELMDSGVIRASQSPFSSPIVMVKKKDGTWRMCIDYRQLNKHTVKDKFPIPVIEELIDELNSSVVFSKLDLRSGYHQIRMNEDDICKTTFRTHEGHYEFLVMPFGLTNAPSTFQSLMNTVFKAFLRKFVLVFFDDILIYNKNLKEHYDHLAQVLQVIKDNTLYAKRTKCYFAVPQVEYLGHIILDQAELAYHKLKEAMVKSPVLALPNFEQEFMVETDASGKGIGAVPCQNGHPIAYWSKTLSAKHQALSTYEKEFLVVVAALDNWKGYLLDRHFKIRTYHFSLKYLLNQKLTTQFQFKWLPKLLGYDYVIVYKMGSKNVVANALSRMDSSGELLQISLSYVSSGVRDKGNKYSWTSGILKRKGKVVVGNDLELRKELVHHFHDEAISGYSGAHVTMKKLGSLFYWKCLKKMVKQMIRDCNISMDFIEKLPTSYGKSVILVVVDRLSKYAHFIPLTHPFTASQVAQVFLDQVYKLHGFPESIVSDRDKVFLSNFWKALFAELKVKLKLSTTYHPQTNGPTEVVNRSLGCYLRCMCGEKPKEWVKWLPLAEFWYNTNYHTSPKTTPYEVVYCQTPPIHVPYIRGDSTVEEVDRTLQAREESH